MQIDRAEAAFRVARGDFEAGRRTPADVADEAERTVLPVIHDAQGRADELLRAATAWARLSQAYRWEVCLARYDYAWRRRVRGCAMATRPGRRGRRAGGECDPRLLEDPRADLITEHEVDAVLSHWPAEVG